MDTRFTGIETQMQTVSDAPASVGGRVQSLEDLIRGLAVGQGALQESVAKMSDGMSSLRDEAHRMSLKRQSDAASEAAASKHCG